MKTTVNPLFKCHADMDTQMIKLSALVETLGFILEGLDKEGTKARKSEVHAVTFANRFPAYSEMLFLMLSGLQDCKGTLDALCEKESALINVTE